MFGKHIQTHIVKDNISHTASKVCIGKYNMFPYMRRSCISWSGAGLCSLKN